MSEAPEIINIDTNAPYRSGLCKDDLIKIEETLGPSDIASWAFRPLGNRMVAELLTYEIYAPEGVLAPFGLPEKPIYRYLIHDIDNGHLVPIKLGDVFYSQAESGLQIPNNFPRVRRTGEQHKLIIQDVGVVCGVFPGHAWSEEDERMIMESKPEVPQDVMEAVKKLTLKIDEIPAIDIEPLGEHVLVEHVPNEAVQGVIKLPQGGKNLPLFKILKMGSNANLPAFLRKLQVGDVVLMQGLGPHMMVPHRMRAVELDDDGNVVESGGLRNIFMAPLGLAMGWYPGLRDIQ